jgi:hypothetical protein
LQYFDPTRWKQITSISSPYSPYKKSKSLISGAPVL